MKEAIFAFEAMASDGKRTSYSDMRQAEKDAEIIDAGNQKSRKGNEWTLGVQYAWEPAAHHLEAFVTPPFSCHSFNLHQPAPPL